MSNPECSTEGEPCKRKRKTNMSVGYLPRNGAFTVLMSLSLAVLAGCGEKPSQQKATPPAVTVAPVEQKQFVEHDEFTGRGGPGGAGGGRPRGAGGRRAGRGRAG